MTAGNTSMGGVLNRLGEMERRISELELRETLPQSVFDRLSALESAPTLPEALRRADALDKRMDAMEALFNRTMDQHGRLIQVETRLAIHSPWMRKLRDRMTALETGLVNMLGKDATEGLPPANPDFAEVGEDYRNSRTFRRDADGPVPPLDAAEAPHEQAFRDAAPRYKGRGLGFAAQRQDELLAQARAEMHTDAPMAEPEGVVRTIDQLEAEIERLSLANREFDDVNDRLRQEVDTLRAENRELRSENIDLDRQNDMHAEAVDRLNRIATDMGCVAGENRLDFLERYASASRNFDKTIADQQRQIDALHRRMRAVREAVNVKE